MACGERFRVGDGPHVCADAKKPEETCVDCGKPLLHHKICDCDEGRKPDPIRAAAEDWWNKHVTNTGLFCEATQREFVDFIRREVERERERCLKLLGDYFAAELDDEQFEKAIRKGGE